jgi:MoaA/NifB/PqqE/SkfB family radical SAM enzyme
MIKSILYHLKNYWNTNVRKDINLILFLTSRCNLGCKHCFYAGNLNKIKKEISVKDIIGLVKQMDGKVKSVAITGGEPFLREDLYSIVKSLCENGVSEIEFNTNGVLSDKIIKIADKIYNLKCNFSFMISIDGLEKTHENIRGVSGVFKKSLKTAEILCNKGFNVYFNTVISKRNVSELEELSKYIDKNTKITHTFEIIRGVSQSGLPFSLRGDAEPKEKGLLMDETDLDNLHNTLVKIFKKRYQDKKHSLITLGAELALIDYKIKTINEKRRMARCLAGRNTFVLYPDGKISYCELMKPIGDIKKSKFADIKQSENSKRQLKVINKCFCNHGCFLDYDSKPLYLFDVLRKSFEILYKRVGR